MAIQGTEDRRLISAWIEPRLWERLDEAAKEADRSRSAELRVVLRQYYDRDEKEER